LDGGNLISLFIPESKKSLMNVFVSVSIIVLVAASFYLKSYLLLLLPALLTLNQFNSMKTEKIKKELQKQGFDLRKSYDELSNDEYWTIRTLIVREYANFKKIDINDIQLSPQEKKITDLVKNVTNESQIVPDFNRVYKTCIIVVLVLCLITPVFYINAMNKSDLTKKNSEIVFDHMTAQEIQKMKTDIMSKMGNNLSHETKVKLTDCYVGKILVIKWADWKKLNSLPIEASKDSFKIVMTECLKSLNLKLENDTIKK